MAPAKGDSLFDRLSAEVVDIITEKVRQDCPKSFRALGKTCKALHDSAQRCAKTLVLKPSKDVSRWDSRLSQSSGLSTDRQLFKDLLLIELSKRPGVSRLVFSYTGYSEDESYAEEYCVVDPLALKPLVGRPWTEIKPDDSVRGKMRNLSFFTPWKDEYPKRLVYQSAASLKRLDLTHFEFRQTEDLATLLHMLPQLESLDLTGSRFLDGSAAPSSLYVRHDKLTRLDISVFDMEPAGVLLAASESSIDVPERVVALHLPSLLHLSARNTVFRRTGASLLEVHIPNVFFPSCLKLLDLYLSDFYKWETRGATLYALLGRDCPELREIHLGTCYPEAKDRNYEMLRQFFNRRRLPKLELVSIQKRDPFGNKWKTVTTIRRGGAIVECERGGRRGLVDAIGRTGSLAELGPR